MESDDWLATHKGEHLYTHAYVWTCDDECGCEQAVVVDYFRNKVVYRARVPVRVWEGEFRTDHESGADADLIAYRRQLRESDPGREAAITWQGGIDY